VPRVIIPLSPVGVWSIAISVSVCLPVCPSARTFQMSHVQISRNFSYILPMAVARPSSDDSAICYVLLVLWFLRYATNRQTNRQTDKLIAILLYFRCHPLLVNEILVINNAAKKYNVIGVNPGLWKQCSLGGLGKEFPSWGPRALRWRTKSSRNWWSSATYTTITQSERKQNSTLSIQHHSWWFHTARKREIGFVRIQRTHAGSATV